MLLITPHALGRLFAGRCSVACRKPAYTIPVANGTVLLQVEGVKTIRERDGL